MAVRERGRERERKRELVRELERELRRELVSGTGPRATGRKYGHAEGPSEEAGEGKPCRKRRACRHIVVIALLG